jgi:hypothetical protein
MSKGESRTSKTCQTVAISKGAKIEMGRDRNGLYRRSAKDSEGIRLHLGSHGSINQGLLFHTCQDDIHRASAGKIVHSKNHLSSWCA